MAGSRTWIAEGVMDQDALRISSVRQIADLPNGAVERDLAMVALRKYLGKQRAVVIGADFPFGLPKALVKEKRWEEFAAEFGNRYADVQDFTAKTKKAAGGQERWRHTDRELGKRSAPHKRRLAYQTFFGIRDILAPLVASGQAAVVPMQKPLPRKPVLLEVCPPASLRRARISPPFKGAAPLARRAREGVLEAYEKRDQLWPVPEDVRERVLDDAEGDALNSVIAALAAAWASGHRDRWTVPADSPYMKEGKIFTE
ncbi:MAG: hypothetical protein ACYTGX_06005 [Planctomycetota bacterium]